MTAGGWWGELGRLVLPVQCAGCGRDDVAWCAACRAPLSGPVWRCEERAGRLDLLGAEPALPVWTLADFLGPLRAAVVAWKDHGRLDLTRPLAEAMVSAGHQVGACLGSRSLLVVPAPSSPGAERRRGGSLVGELAVAAAAGCTAAGSPATARAVLVRRGGDQVGLGARDRWLNLAGHVRVRRRDRGRLRGSRVLLLDDVLTTGATLAACRAALEAHGATVLGALTLASTPPPGGVSG
ncbi:ComF family protein [Cellulomonas edaphi]|uniref:Phosphoribosyltransferase family protein n=1 Tax=Cellulomonas edaphi TaxID=3053468 RepID=A0ABT7S9U6_9CELL|nr:phosphoribosyltransferase family protein [Cellulomons edaphi]MDM7831724.1 phosphoribosyltransferase family protein [Cellulomons edaphi]